MGEVNNNHIAYMVVLVIAVVFVGMVFSLNRIGEIETGLGITGMLATNNTGTATLSATVASSTAISLPVSAIDLGSLQPGEWNSSENSTYTHGGPFDTDRYNTSNITENITIQNDGSINVDIEIYMEEQVTAGNGNFSGTAGCITTNNCFMIRCANVINMNSTGGNCTTPQHAYIALPKAAGTEFVSDLNFTDTDDEAFIVVNVTIPEDEHAGAFTQTLTFTAAAVS